jgi:hypothetical protein
MRVGPFSGSVFAQAPAKTKIILDTDIGDDIDDAFALALALRSPEVEILGITTAWGDTALRARLTQRFLYENGASEIPIAVGIATRSTAAFSQARWAQDGAPFEKQTDAVEFLLKQAQKNPGEITLVAIGPLTNRSSDRPRSGCISEIQTSGSDGRFHQARLWRLGLHTRPRPTAGVQHL